MLNSESLNKVLENQTSSRDEIIQIYQDSTEDPTELFSTATELRGRNKKNTVTFSKKAFFNIVNLCKDTCSYCTYKAEPGEEKLSLMSKNQIIELLLLAKKYHCVEALFVTGEQPEQRYPEARKWLKENGFESTSEYLIYASEKALEVGLFPHTNAGNLSYDEMKELKKTNVSMGLMLENVSERLSDNGMPHFLASSKRPKARLEVLENSGKVGIPTDKKLWYDLGDRFGGI